MTGRKESNKLPTTRRVRNFDPNTPIRRSAKSLIRFRARTKVSVTNSRNTKADNAARKTVCCVVLGLINGRSNDDSESRMANSRKLPAASIMIRRFRFFGAMGLPEAINHSCRCVRDAAEKHHYSLGCTRRLPGQTQSCSRFVCSFNSKEDGNGRELRGN